MARPWFALYPNDYIGDTLTLSTEQHGAYLLLLMAYWNKQGPLPDDDDQLAAICRLPVRAFRKHKPLLTGFFAIEGGLWRSKRMEQEIAKTNDIIATKSAAGKKSAALRHLGGNGRSTDVGTGAPTERQQAGQQKTNPSPSPSPPPSFSKEINGKAEEADEMPEFFRRAPPVQTRIVAGGFKQIGAGKRIKNPRRADEAMEAYLASHCALPPLDARNMVSAARWLV
jgi:uncharacterized protein YdaU (DUF1376 family)